ncbi:hypothetical protein NLX71_14505 [Paenibacillus sp. MZ04-78.2]|uniref:hypothetical protein n=1 Tax=Paenibacillus sp. MZ04-78.2 TaxID=2962034 RepID=UPI0020B6E5AC|nr:hypothetical protein [Paenibacillus sp. MZ04-78.2]MCP3774509.1 hypothetical protein [Paenibacillus sp. MZ04-78.2]
MDKQKFFIPMPDDRTIESEIKQIVSAAAEHKDSFLSHLKAMYRQVGLGPLFSDRAELTFLLLAGIALISLVFWGPQPGQSQAHEMYSLVFTTSPVLFLVLSVYTYVNKIRNATYEVEMACKYNVYQVIAFRMLAFSVVSILVNAVMIFLIVMTYEDIQFIRAFMISVTALFAYSILFLYAMIKRRSAVVAALLVAGWMAGNLALRYTGSRLYIDMLLHLPTYVYGVVLLGTLYGYLKHLNKLIYYKPAERSF